MFTGIVQSLGQIVEALPLSQGKRLTIEAPHLGLDDVALGDSIALNGACMTVVAKTATQFSVDISAESLAKTVGLNETGQWLNLEKALRLGDALGGHLVSGHVDGTGTVQAFEARGESWHLAIRAPQALAPYLAYKGSITVNGVSLTVNEVHDHAAGCDFSMNLIPHTLQVTTLGQLKLGSEVNLEIDLIARYVQRMLN